MSSEDLSSFDFLRQEMRQARTNAGLSQEDLGKRAHVSSSLISAVETGARPLQHNYVSAIDNALGTGGFFERLLARATRAGEPTWFREWRVYEHDAVSLWYFEISVIPGLLQTEAYARAVLGSGGLLSPDAVEQRVGARLNRQGVLHRENPPQVIVVVDEAVLRRAVGGVDVMREQLDHLQTLAALPHVHIQVVPSAVQEYPGMAGPFAIAGLADNTYVAHLDTPLRGQVVSDAQDVGSVVRRWESVRSEAASCRESTELISKVRKELWT